MKKLPALLTLGAAAVLLSGCSGQLSTLSACGEVASQAVQITGVVDSLTSATPETAQAALDEVRGVVENLKGIDGPTEFVTLRDSWTASIDTLIVEGEQAIAGDTTGLDAATAELRTATEAVVAYCTP